MRRIVLTAAAAACLAVAAGAQQAPSPDQSLAARVETLYVLDDDLNAFDLVVEVEGDAATLQGSVDDEIQKDLAEELAYSVDGIDEVDNNLVIEPGEAPRQTDENRQQMRQSVKDATLRARVRRQLNFQLAGLDEPIEVSVDDGVVTLGGAVPGYGERRRMERVVINTRGVREVVNELEVEQPDEDDAANIQRERVAQEDVGQEAVAREGVQRERVAREPVAREQAGQSGVAQDNLPDVEVPEAGEVQDDEDEDALTRGVRDTAEGARQTAQRWGRRMSDEWVEKRVESALLWNRNIDLLTLEVEVEEGTCTLVGRTLSQAQKDLAGEIASQVRGVDNVVNDIEVRPAAE
jgi:osmotically-inducible protein OsmY